MAILVIAGGTDLDVVVVERLVAQGDEVRVLETSGVHRDRWRGRGVFLAVGAADDPDLVERAAQNVRTVVILPGRVTAEVVANVLEVAPRAGVDRLVCCAPAIPTGIRSAVRFGPLDHVMIQTGRPGLLRRRSVAPGLIAEAVDAADDLADEPRLEIELTDPQQVKLLGL